MSIIHRIKSCTSARRLLAGAILAVSCFGLLGARYAFRTTERADRTLYRYAISAPTRNAAEGRALRTWLVRNSFDIAGTDWQAGTIEVITDDAGLNRLHEQGLKGTILQRRVPGLRIAVDPQYLNPQKVEDGLKALSVRFPNLTRLEQIGTSLEGRPIWALLISTTPDPRDPRALEKPTVLFDGMHHAREVMTPEIVFDIAETLLSQTRQRNSGILDRWNVWVVPMLNVDGNNMVWTKDTWWRKNTHADQSRIHGVDINRNYPFNWGSCNGSSSSKTAQDYRGEGIASEPETQALMRLGQMTRPTVSVSYHSYGELILYPFGCERQLSGDNALLEKVAKEMAAVLPTDSGRGTYAPGTPWQILYGVDGDSMSYMHSEFGALAFTLEVNRAFQPPYSLREPTLQKHRKGWQFLLNRLDSNLLTLQVIDGRGRFRAPMEAAVEISTIARRQGEKPFRTNAAGNLFKPLDPGRYMLRITLPDGRSTEMTVEMRGEPQLLQAVVP